MVQELNDKIQAICNCSTCEYKENCSHKDSFRRYPYQFGGVGACKKLKGAK